MRTRQGFVLVTVLGILIILGLLGAGLSWVASGELALLRSSVGRLRAYAAARAGIVYAQTLLVSKPSQGDVLGRVGAVAAPADKALVFHDLRLGEDERFDVVYPAALYIEASEPRELPGVTDEMGRLNINLVHSAESPAAFVLAELIERLEPEAGQKLSEAVVAFKAAADGTGARIFFFPEDLLLVQGITPALFKKLKPLITVYPYQTGALKLNVYTAPALVVSAVFQGLAENKGLGMDTSRDARTFLACREEALAGEDNAVLGCGLPSYLSIFDLGPFHSGLYRIRSAGTDVPSDRHVTIEAVVSVNTAKASIVAWRRE